MKTYLDCWISVAASLFSQALAGEPELVDSLVKPPGEGAFGFVWTLAGDLEGSFAVSLDGAILDAPLMGEGVDQKVAWKELLRETADAAAGDLLAATKTRCRVAEFEEIGVEGQFARGLELRSGERKWTVLIRDDTRTVATRTGRIAPDRDPDASASSPLSPGLELLLDVELETSLRFGAREMALSEILDLGPGDVVELDRHVADPVDLIVGDKIVARGEVVLVNGNFGLRVTEVAAPRKRLESIRCLF
jgi:flagellar motor switch protein FliN